MASRSEPTSPGRIVQMFRATGADVPFGDPLTAHGVGMEGYFWRITDAVNGRVVIALIGVNRDDQGGRWATVGLAGHPGGFLKAGAIEGASAETGSLGASTDDGTFIGRPGRVKVDFGERAMLDLTIHDEVGWPRRRFGGSSWFHSVPALNQYWHPHILDGVAEGNAVIDGERWELTGSRVYAEKNWGRGGFPKSWWWGQAQGFADPDACVCFAGGRVETGPLGLEVTALVVRAGGQFLRLGDPLISPVKAEVDDENWLLVARSARWEVTVEGSAPLGAAHVLPVPLPAERRNIAAALEHLGGTMKVKVRRRGGEVVWSGESQLAGLEHGGRERAEAEAARRGSNADGSAGPVGPLLP